MVIRDANGMMGSLPVLSFEKQIGVTNHLKHPLPRDISPHVGDSVCHFQRQGTEKIFPLLRDTRGLLEAFAGLLFK